MESNRAALYCRISSGDEQRFESNSIANQRSILKAYAKNKCFKIIDEYIDDGYSGANFDRPNFMRMIDDATNGKFSVILTKDQSRLGREYLETGWYMEQIFPRMGIRFIAVNDSYDSLSADDNTTDIAPIRNYFNELHAKDTSRKVRAAFNSMAKEGKFIGSKAPFGYIKDPEDKHHLLIDPVAAETVKSIFDLACNNLGYKAIAKKLRENKILNPNAYINLNNPEFYKSAYWKQPHDWHSSSIKVILTNPTYLGHIVNFRRQIMSYKIKKTIKNSKEKWCITKNMHEPIISQDIWDKVQTKLEARRTGADNKPTQIFAGLAKCFDCGYALSYCSNQNGGCYNCSQYAAKGKEYCNSHFISYNELYQTVLKDIQDKAALVVDKNVDFRSRLSISQTKAERSRIARLKKEHDALREKASELDSMIMNYYEDRLDGKVPEEEFWALFSVYKDELSEMKQRCADISVELSAHDHSNKSVELFVSLLIESACVEQLDTELLNKLIDKIEVEKIRMESGHKARNIRIIYKYVGYID